MNAINEGAGPSLSQLLLFFTFLFLVGITLAGTWKAFEKAGYPGWAAIIPVYNLYVVVKIAGKPGYWTILSLLPWIGFIWALWAVLLFARSYGRSRAFRICTAVFPFIFVPIIGFNSKIEYLGPDHDGQEVAQKDINAIGAA